MADDHGTDALGCYGNPVIQTPNLDKLAAEGVRFTNAFCTTASCSPSRSVLLTGLHNHANGMYGLEHTYHHFNSFENVAGLPELLAKKGYRTARVGKFHVAPEKVFQFQTVLSAGQANDPNALGRSPVEMAAACKAFISQPGKPFFLYFASDDPHRSNGVLPNGHPTFNSYPAPNLFGNRRQGYPGIKEIVYAPDKVIVPPFLPDNAETRAELAQYYQAVSRLDQGVGQLIQILKDAGQYENSLIIYLSDNGVAFPGAKTTLYDPGMKLPLIVRRPGKDQKSFVQPALVSWVDITPTILDYAGASSGTKLQGKSFRAVLENEKAAGQTEIYASHSLHEITMYYPMRVIRTPKYKLIYNLAHELTFPFALDLVESSAWQSVQKSKSNIYGQRAIQQFLHRPKFELYDLEKDPGEINNLAQSKSHQEVFNQLLTKMKQFQKETSDPWYHKWTYE
ncbi:heparan N-sulfatase [Adhaeribacter aerolatus]|uniref:Heparan N-sulfatase n=1 Tax=Adhaeribacter aerolatus TaxID=670289 RepID=A0A512B655_9BACT|nr:heparan N-sulfatase [Adhaeribacter aerolatus]